MDAEATKLLAAGIAMGFATIGPGIGIGLLTSGATQSIARQPEAGGDVRTVFIIGLALAEALALYAFVIAIILIFVA
jgi:F-type H+-transporting ATPase subunit c